MRENKIKEQITENTFLQNFINSENPEIVDQILEAASQEDYFNFVKVAFENGSEVHGEKVLNRIFDKLPNRERVHEETLKTYLKLIIDMSQEQELLGDTKKQKFLSLIIACYLKAPNQNPRILLSIMAENDIFFTHLFTIDAIQKLISDKAYDFIREILHNYDISSITFKVSAENFHKLTSLKSCQDAIIYKIQTAEQEFISSILNSSQKDVLPSLLKHARIYEAFNSIRNTPLFALDYRPDDVSEVHARMYPLLQVPNFFTSLCLTEKHKELIDLVIASEMQNPNKEENPSLLLAMIGYLFKKNGTSNQYIQALTSVPSVRGLAQTLNQKDKGINPFHLAVITSKEMKKALNLQAKANLGQSILSLFSCGTKKSKGNKTKDMVLPSLTT